MKFWRVLHWILMTWFFFPQFYVKSRSTKSDFWKERKNFRGVYCTVYHRTQQNINKSRNLHINDKLWHLKLSIYRFYCNLFIFCHSLFCVSTIPKPTGFLLKPSSLCLEGEIWRRCLRNWQVTRISNYSSNATSLDVWEMPPAVTRLES